MRLSAVLLPLFLIVISPFILAAGVSADQSDSPRISFNRGYFKSESDVVLRQFKQEIETPLTKEGFRRESGLPQTFHDNCDCHSEVWVRDAVFLLSDDFDHDHFFHSFKLEFDLDTDQADTFVFARIFLSFEGGPWNKLFTTNTIHLQQNSRVDTYVVESLLDSGYPTGYYDVLIEVFEINDDRHSSEEHWLLGYGPNEDRSLRAVPLESQSRDHGAGTSFGYGIYGSGAFNWLFLLSLLGLELVKNPLKIRITQIHRLSESLQAEEES